MDYLKTKETVETQFDEQGMVSHTSKTVHQEGITSDYKLLVKSQYNSKHVERVEITVFQKTNQQAPQREYTHAGIAWTDGKDISVHVKLAVDTTLVLNELRTKLEEIVTEISSEPETPVE